MRSSLVAMGLLSVGLAIGVTSVRAAVPVTPSEFSMLITHTATGWTAHCDSGCHWTDLSLSCQASCGAVVDENGLTSPADTLSNPSRFAFELTRTESGPSAVARYGTTWQSVSWRCNSSPCRARLNASGVEALLNAP